MNQPERLKISTIKLNGFKSIHPEGEIIPLKDITILLGANGSGKSNLVSFFNLLNSMMNEALQIYIGENGGSETLLYYGLKNTNFIGAEIKFTSDATHPIYKFSLSHAAGDTMIFTEETIWNRAEAGKIPYTLTFDPGLKESGLPRRCQSPNHSIELTVFELLHRCPVFQFHDTSKQAKIRNKGYIDDNIFLRSDGGNLAAFLYGMRNNHQNHKYYQRIVRYIQNIMPQFGDFQLKPSRLNEN